MTGRRVGERKRMRDRKLKNHSLGRRAGKEHEN